MAKKATKNFKMNEPKKIGYRIVLILMLLVSLPAHGAVIFSDGYEAGDHSNWTNTNTYGSGSLAEVLATNPYSGTYAGHYYRTGTGDGDFYQVVILRSTATISDTPVEGTEYTVGNTIGSGLTALKDAVQATQCKWILR
jgi:hypothetical protein